MRFLIRGLKASALLCVAMFCAGQAQAAPIVVVPGDGAGYMYFPQEATVGGSSGTTSVTVNVGASPSVPPSVMTPEEAGTCETVSVIGEECEWGDGRKFKYAGTLGSKKLFAEVISPSSPPYLMWGCYYVVTGATSLDDGLSNTNTVLAVNHAYNPCVYAGDMYPAVAHLYCQQKNMYLPAKNELLILLQNGVLPQFYRYWSSTEESNGKAFCMIENNWEIIQKSGLQGVHCIRSFE